MVSTTLLIVALGSMIIVVVVVVLSTLWLQTMTFVFIKRVNPDSMFTIESEGELSLCFHFTKRDAFSTLWTLLLPVVVIVVVVVVVVVVVTDWSFLSLSRSVVVVALGDARP
jgi:hypothetical protein